MRSLEQALAERAAEKEKEQHQEELREQERLRRIEKNKEIALDMWISHLEAKYDIVDLGRLAWKIEGDDRFYITAMIEGWNLQLGNSIQMLNGEPFLSKLDKWLGEEWCVKSPYGSHEIFDNFIDAVLFAKTHCSENW